MITLENPILIFLVWIATGNDVLCFLSLSYGCRVMKTDLISKERIKLTGHNYWYIEKV